MTYRSYLKHKQLGLAPKLRMDYLYPKATTSIAFLPLFPSLGGKDFS